MNKRKLVSLLVFGLLTCVIGVGAVGYRAVSAQTPTPVPGNPGGEDVPGGRGGMRYGYSDEDLATALGITVDKLRSAIETVSKKSESLLAQELGITVEKLQAAIEQAESAAHNGKPEAGQDQDNMLKACNALQSDSSYQTTMQASYKEAISKAVSSGVITQAEADKILAQNEAIKFPACNIGAPGGGPAGGPGQGQNPPPGTAPSKAPTKTSS